MSMTEAKSLFLEQSEFR